MNERIMSCRACGWHGPESEIRLEHIPMDIGCVDTFQICPECGATERFEPWFPGIDTED